MREENKISISKEGHQIMTEMSVDFVVLFGSKSKLILFSFLVFCIVLYVFLVSFDLRIPLVLPTGISPSSL